MRNSPAHRSYQEHYLGDDRHHRDNKLQQPLQPLNLKHDHHHHHNRNPHFIAGIGDGNHNVYDLPDPGRSFVRRKKEVEDIYNRHHRSKNRHEQQHQHLHNPNHGHDLDQPNTNGDPNGDGDGNDDHQHHHLHPPNPPLSQAQQLQQQEQHDHFEPLSHQIQNSNEQLQTSFMAILGMISVFVTISYFISDYYSRYSKKNNSTINSININHHKGKVKSSPPSSSPKHSHHQQQKQKQQNQKKQQQSNSIFESIKSSLQSISLSSINITSLTSKAKGRRLSLSRKTKLQIPVITGMTGMRRTDSSIVRTKKKKTDEWNEDDEEDCDSHSHSHSSPTSSRARARTHSVGYDNNQTIQNHNHFYHPHNTHTHAHHHLQHMDVYYRKETPRLRKHAAIGGGSSTTITSTSSNNNNNNSNTAVTSSLSSRPHGAVFQSGSKEFSVENHLQPQQGRYTTHSHDHDNAVEIGIGLDGFDASSSSDYHHSHQDINSNKNSSSHDELEMGTSSAVPAGASKDKNIITAAKLSDDNHNQDRDMNSTISSMDVSDEEWDQLSASASVSVSVSARSSPVTPLLSGSNQSQSNHSEQSVVHVPIPVPVPHQQLFFDSLNPPYAGGAAGAGSGASSCCSRHDDGDGGNDIDIESPGYSCDEEMPTPKIDNVQQQQRQNIQLQPKGAFVSSSASSYSTFTMPGIPGLPNLSSMESTATTITTTKATKANERKHEGSDHNDDGGDDEGDALGPLPPPPPPMVFQSLSLTLPQPQRIDEGSNNNNSNEIKENENNKSKNKSNNIMDSTIDQDSKNNAVNSFVAKSPAPRSISVEELKLIRMETGMVSPGSSAGNRGTLLSTTGSSSPQDFSHGKHATKQNNISNFKMLSSPPNCKFVNSGTLSIENIQCDRVETDYLTIEDGKSFPRTESNNRYEALGNGGSDKNDEADDDDNDLSEGETEGANGIMHKRKNLTLCTDAASSLTTPIAFSELKMKELIGGGGFGQVWEASWRGTPVAVKVLSVSHKAEHIQKAILQEFAAEINMVSGMRHPNICLYIGACLEPSNRAIVTELATNGSLWDALRQPLKPPYFASDGKTRNAWPLSLYETIPETSKLQISVYSDFGPPVPFGTSPYVPLSPEGSWPWFLVRRIAEGAARGMNYLHFGNPPVLHRDLKSANILLDDSYNAKVADFGLSRLKAQQRSMTGNCGTVQWMAPEILANESYAEPADVYSYGIILWELLVKECPYGDMTPIQCALAVLRDSRPEIPEWCPPSFRALILRCMAKDPAKRPTFAEIIAILDALK